jgi:HPr kinase/phosphorylase
VGAPRDVHGACVVVGEAGILIRGASGSGKSTLALAVVEAATGRGLFARLVADDRVMLGVVHGRLVARPHPALAGLVEERGIGIVPAPYLPAAILRLVVDLEPAPRRLPERADAVVEGVALPACVLPSGRARAESILRRLGAATPLVASPGS